MATHGFKVIDSDGKETSYKNYDAWLASENAANKIANKIIESTNTAGSAMESVGPGSINYRKNGDNKTTFKNGGEKEAAAGGTLDQVAGEYAEDKFTPTGVWEYDLGYALGRARKKKIDAAGGKEAFKSAKRQKRSETAMRTVGKLQSVSGVGDYGKDKKQQRKQSRAIAKEKKSFTPISKMQTIQPNKQQLRKIFGQIGSTTMTNKTEVKGLPKKSNPYKPF